MRKNKIAVSGAKAPAEKTFKKFRRKNITGSENKLTPFEWKVLAATAKIPLGQTRSYQWIAKAIGKPQAVRAVGQALGRNPFPLIIPCHRVVKSDGSLGGYAGGSKMKMNLLRLEEEIARHLRERK
ncbi:MAG TPA: MGMT family protein [Candidatus Omnitrophota bacterium]|nr:MGMT family protein [Candidatus Omnitrophota bacterium]HPD84420.1 MGMT family protein [Candidatus Omnitrophota bacterium]HRZ03278.1 MGMT family protein [Candidatus Omnitrophota bacterium]